jgi:hypothetical protein
MPDAGLNPSLLDAVRAATEIALRRVAFADFHGQRRYTVASLSFLTEI